MRNSLPGITISGLAFADGSNNVWFLYGTHMFSTRADTMGFVHGLQRLSLLGTRLARTTSAVTSPFPSQRSAYLLYPLTWSCIAVCICVYLGPSRPYMLSENSLIKAFV
jgi:hypothetical protein